MKEAIACTGFGDLHLELPMAFLENCSLYWTSWVLFQSIFSEVDFEALILGY